MSDSDDGGWMNLIACVHEDDMISIMEDVYHVGWKAGMPCQHSRAGDGLAAKMKNLKQHVVTVIRLVEALTSATLPSCKFQYNCKAVRKCAKRAVMGEFPPRKAAGWTEIMACVVALTVLTDYTDEGGELDDIMGRADQVHGFAVKETADLKRTVMERENRDAKEQGRAVVDVAKSAPDIGNVAKWSDVRNYFFKLWSDFALKECLSCLNSFVEDCAPSTDVSTALAKLPKLPWQKEETDDFLLRAKALLKDGEGKDSKGGKDDDDNLDDFAPVHTESQGMPVDEGFKDSKDSKGFAASPASPPHSDSESSVTGDEDPNQEQEKAAPCGKGSGSASPSTAESAKPSEPAKSAGREEKKRVRSKKTETEVYDASEQEQDAKRSKFNMLRDAAVFATIAYGQALHSIQDAGPSESKNIGCACNEIGFLVREKLPLPPQQ